MFHQLTATHLFSLFLSFSLSLFLPLAVSISNAHTHAHTQVEVTSDLVSDSSYVTTNGNTRFAFNFTVQNWQKINQAPTLTIKASTRNPFGTELEVWDDHGIDGVNDVSFPLYLLQPEITSFKITQSSCYPCDNNTILVEFTTNTPIFAACRPTFTLTGLTGSVKVSNSTSLNLVSSTSGVSANSTTQTAASVYWEQSTGLMHFGVHSDIGSHPWPHHAAAPSSVTFEFTLTNQEQSQDAPTLGFSGKYNKAAIDVGWDFASSDQVWTMSGDFGNTAAHLWKTKHGRDVYQTNAGERRPMFIRAASFIESRIAQSYPWFFLSLPLSLSRSVWIDMQHRQASGCSAMSTRLLPLYSLYRSLFFARSLSLLRARSLCTHTHTHTYIHKHTNTHTHTHIYIYIYIYTCMQRMRASGCSATTTTPLSFYSLPLSLSSVYSHFLSRFLSLSLSFSPIIYIPLSATQAFSSKRNHRQCEAEHRSFVFVQPDDLYLKARWCMRAYDPDQIKRGRCRQIFKRQPKCRLRNVERSPLRWRLSSFPDAQSAACGFAQHLFASVYSFKHGIYFRI